MSRICRRNMDDSVKHRFHGLEYDSKMRLSKIYSHTSTLRGYEAPGKMLRNKTESLRLETGNGLQKTQRQWQNRQTHGLLLSSDERGQYKQRKNIERKRKISSRGCSTFAHWKSQVHESAKNLFWADHWLSFCLWSNGLTPTSSLIP